MEAIGWRSGMVWLAFLQESPGLCVGKSERDKGNGRNFGCEATAVVEVGGLVQGASYGVSWW